MIFHPVQFLSLRHSLCFHRLYLSGFHQRPQEEQWCCVPWVLSKLSCETLRLFCFCPHSLEVPQGDSTLYASLWSSHLSPAVWHFLPFLLLVPNIFSSDLVQGASVLIKTTCAHEADYICWCQSCQIPKPALFIVSCFFIKSHQSPNHCTSFLGFMYKGLNTGPQIRVTDVFPTLKQSYLFSISSLCPLNLCWVSHISSTRYFSPQVFFNMKLPNIQNHLNTMV